MVLEVRRARTTAINNNARARKAAADPSAISARPATTSTPIVFRVSATSRARSDNRAIRTRASATASRISPTTSAPSVRRTFSTIRSASDVVVTRKARPIISRAATKSCAWPPVSCVRARSTSLVDSATSARIVTTDWAVIPRRAARDVSAIETARSTSSTCAT